ncbi:DNA mismatch repair protein MutT [Bacillus sp. SA1-12]|uniref:NUDIX hydrolase n=1 Tax=Bacillus sp. SA1-12 TaxID=1455638 RepID=UPI000624F6A7|nr:NUDIX hydrolase [Bacillus sp. SA1-12]KKI92090.1 DNA mismatch repair protein MutT [Bacillus sp. SA1-12]
MKKRLGSAGVCIKEKKVLMVLQGKQDEPKRWSVPSGGLEERETFEECCVRELREETGFNVEVIRPIFQKESHYGDVRYFDVKIIGGEAKIQDPDNLIYNIAWKNIEEIKTLDLSFLDDRAFLIDYMTRESKSKSLFK